MVHQQIKVYARLKKECRRKPTITYEIMKTEKDYEDLMFYPGSRCLLNSNCGFRFYKVFNENTSQEEIFELVAKPVINSVLEGFNGTIFAYGQTGSGKTYSLTGSSKNYNERGIIPRSIQYIFQQYENVSEKPTIYISYMEIYNEIGYDLLSTKQSKVARIFEELPRVHLLEDKKGDAHIRNLSVIPVTTEQETMRLLFLGDTNRTIAETVANEFSSRSHCIFTLYINLRDGNSANLRSSKLHLVDLAGSERISKSQTKGQCLQEAKSINLSLHFLQQVILALSESNRTHIPYRNSMLTHILKDSVNGNCFTSMLATLSTLKTNSEESISTCRFAQKVSMVTTDPVKNVLDPQREIDFLKLKVEDLEKRLSIATGFANSKSLSKEKMEGYLVEVKSFVETDKKLITVEPDMTEIQFCFNLLKNEVETKKKECTELENSLMKKTTEVNLLNEELYTKNKEIVHLKNIIDGIPENPVPLKPPDYKPPTTIRPPSPSSTINKTVKRLSTEEEDRLYEIFTSSPEISETLDYYKHSLEMKFNTAKNFAEIIEKCQQNINHIRQKLDTPLSWSERNNLVPELEQNQLLYKKKLMELKNIQNETFHLQCGLEKAEVKAQHLFKVWLEEYKNSGIQQAEFSIRKLFKEKLSSTSFKEDIFTPDPLPLDCHSYGDSTELKFKRSSYSDDIDSSLNSFSIPIKDSDYYFQSPNCFDPSYKVNYVSSNNELKKNDYDATLQNNKFSRNLQYIHCCQKFNSDSTIPPSSSWASYQDLTSSPCYNPEINNTPIQQKYVGNIPEDLVATKDSNCSIETVKNVDFVGTKDCISSISSKEDLQVSRSGCTETKSKSLLQESLVQEIAKKESLNVHDAYFHPTDTIEFKDFMKTVSLTGLAEVDEEIFKFYRSKF